ncbi:uncharacterized protein LOC113873417 isoform X2 [Abrus precatorius]|uniref:Uncharacterized protein LOC113873417 isoform X2 n=1 Tax=Abrus precatorius TaxID=3816 RepID=A0A8B8MHH3_ABRPR|nr:uncharacterized protein LOC113873417 isoform X2 [Abrus precatorius]
MKSVGSYNDWPYYSSPPSNLSAFAAPFSVNRSTSSEVSAPFMESADSVDAVPPIHFRSYGYDFFSKPVRELDSSKSYGYSGLQSGLDSSSAQFPHLGLPSKDAFSYDHSTKSSLVEAQPYYPSYVSSAIHDPSSSVAPNHWSSSSGFPSLDGTSLGDYVNKPPELRFATQSSLLWNQFPEFNSHGKGKHVGVGSSFSSKQTDVTGSVVEESVNQGYQDVKDSNNIDWEKHSVSAIANQLDDKSCLWGTSKTVPVEFLGRSVMQSPSMSIETHQEAPLKTVVDSGYNPLSYTGSYDKHSRQGDKPSTVPSIPKTGLTTDLNVGNIIVDGDIGHNNFYNSKEAYHMPSPGTGGCFDLGNLRMHLERNEPSSSNNAMISDKNVSRDVVDYMFKGIHGFQNSRANMDNLSLRLSAIEDVNSVEKSFEGGDRCNPAVDSPCWKGASAAHFSHYESYEALTPEHVHKNKHCFGSVIQEPQNCLLDTENNAKKSYENSNRYQMHSELVCQENGSAGSPRKFSVSKFASQDCKSDGSVNVGPFQTEPLSYYGLQYLDDITEMKENSVPPAKPADCESESSHTEHQVVDENELMSQKQDASCIGDADAGCNVNKSYESSTLHTANHALSSSVIDTTTAPEKSTGKVSTQNLNVQMLVDTMQNLSELLLCHCLNGGCELKERDCNVLKNVITNLNKCALKNAEQIVTAQESLFDQPETSRCAEESCALQQSASFNRPQLTKTGPERSKVEFEKTLVADANLHFRSGKPKDDAEMTKADNMTKALKQILSENFHDDEEVEPQTVLYKNLWLEAEAALCSVYYRARYNQMKLEMDKYSHKEIEEESKSEVVPTLRQIQSSATKVHNYPNPDPSGQDFPVLEATTNPKEPADLKFSADINKPNGLTPGGKGSQNLDGIIQNYTVSSTDKEARRNDEASVMARYHVLKARVDKTHIDTCNLEEPSDIADKSAPGGRDNQNLVDFCKDSPIPEKNKADSEASVVARFHILKSRVDDSGSISSDGKLLNEVGSVGKGTNDTTIAKNATEGKSLDIHVNPGVHLNSYTAVDMSIPKEFHLDLEDNQEIQPRGTYEFQLPTYYYSDGLASDWEHVEKKSL